MELDGQATGDTDYDEHGVTGPISSETDEFGASVGDEDYYEEEDDSSPYYGVGKDGEQEEEAYEHDYGAYATSVDK